MNSNYLKHIFDQKLSINQLEHVQRTELAKKEVEKKKVEENLKEPENKNETNPHDLGLLTISMNNDTKDENLIENKDSIQNNTNKNIKRQSRSRSRSRSKERIQISDKKATDNTESTKAFNENQALAKLDKIKLAKERFQKRKTVD